LKQITIASKLPFSEFDDDLMVYADGSFGKGFRLTGIDISCATPDFINEFSRKIESLLIGLPEKMRLQVFYRLAHSAEEIINTHHDVSSASDQLYQPIREARMEFLKAKLRDGRFFIPQIYFFMRSEGRAVRKAGFFQKKKDFSESVASDYKSAKARFEISVAQIEAALKSAALSPESLTPGQWGDLCFSYFNFERKEQIGTPAIRFDEEPLAPTLNEQLALTNISIAEKALSIGNIQFRTISLAMLPEGETFASMIDGLTKLPFHFWMSQNILSLDQRKEIQKLELSRRIAHSMVSGSKHVTDLESESKFASLEELLRELMNGSEKLVSSDLNLIFWGETTEELEQKTEEILRSFRQLNQAEGLVETFALQDSFFKAAPGVCEGFRHRKMKSSNCAHLMPLYANWTGNKVPVVLLANREGAPFAISPFEKSLPAWNGLIFGGTGSGKSFTISQLMLQFYGQTPKPKIVWIDNGASTENLIEILGGEFVDLHLESGIRINMFDLEGETVPSSSKIKLILGCLELILKDDDVSGLPKRDKALLEEAIFECYKRTPGAVPTVAVLKALLAAHDVLEMRKYADILFSWTGETAYGRMLDGQTNVQLDKDIVTIEIKGLDNHKELKDIFLLLFTSFIKAEAARDLTRPYMLIIDEAHRLFAGSPAAREFAIDSYRVFRKYNAALWLASQNYRDFLSDPELAASLLPNTTTVMILRQRKIDWADFKSVFDLTDAQVEAAKSPEIVKGKYSEFFLIQDEKCAVVRLEPEPLSYWACTSDASDKAKILDLQRKTPDLPRIDVLKQLAKGA
jgi:conjugal transfer ATP-binding protein TraC